MSHASMVTFGLAIVAVGAEIPDCIQSVTVARKGYGSMAVSIWLAHSLQTRNAKGSLCGVRACARVYVRARVCVRVCACVYVCVRVCVCVCVCLTHCCTGLCTACTRFTTLWPALVIVHTRESAHPHNVT